MIKMIHLIAIVTLSFCISCKAKEIPMGADKGKTQAIVIDKSLSKVFDMAHKIDTAYIKGDVLMLKVTCYSSCKSDTFELVSNAKFAKSNPPMTAVFFRRKASKTDCKETLHQELKFDVIPLRYPLMNKVIINLDERQQITYNY